MSREFVDIGHQVYKRIKNKILGLELELGGRINLRAMSRELSVSLTPVREAVKKLVEEGLVLFKPRQGYYVYAPTLKDIKEIYGLRKILEKAAIASLKDGVKNLSSFEDLKRTIKCIKSLPDEEREKEFPKTEAIHTFIIYSLGNDRVNSVYQNLYDFTLLFQHVIQCSAKNIIEIGLEQHFALVNAILRKDIYEANRIIEKHYDVTIIALSKLILKRKDSISENVGFSS